MDRGQVSGSVLWKQYFPTKLAANSIGKICMIHSQPCGWVIYMSIHPHKAASPTQGCHIEHHIADRHKK